MKNHKPIDRLIEQYELHNMLFKNAIEGIKDEDAKVRINEKTNHMLWLAGNLASTRYDLAKNLGVTVENTYAEFYENHKSYQEGMAYPNLEKLLKNWNTISPVLKEKLESLSDAALFKEPDFKTPPMFNQTLLRYILFLIDRESYVIGQLAFIRKALSYEAMKYN
ncbi:hypothetical protein Q4Q35_01915 [Flavivirga aquimarina]|uniref:DinB family protein n=1 Tax=Flavivirga aquimarina TaxID=2027862 RepID=A0ABT8W608_9FLAO|nr:hypothetical protein [Flavivirga aquimarina]MDO5968552.1 hypothetical protein [Flavivirga aquimarina]